MQRKHEVANLYIYITLCGFLNSIPMALCCCHLCDSDLFFVDERDKHGRLETKVGRQCECEVVAACHIIDVAAQPGAETRTELVAEGDETEENRHVPGSEEIARQRRSERDGSDPGEADDHGRGPDGEIIFEENEQDKSEPSERVNQA